MLAGFYLRYLRGRSSPPLPLPPIEKNYCNHYRKEVTRSKKSSSRDGVSAHEASIPCLRTLYDKEHGGLQTAGLTTGAATVTSQNCVSKCLFFPGLCPWNALLPPWKLVSFGHSGLLTIIRSENPSWIILVYLQIFYFLYTSSARMKIEGTDHFEMTANASVLSIRARSADLRRKKKRPETD